MYNELLDTTANYDIHANATDAVLSSVATVTAHENTDPVIETSRIDAGEASCIELVNSNNAAFFITDDLRALPELLLRALVTQDVLKATDEQERPDQIAQSRDWLGVNIYYRAQKLFVWLHTDERLSIDQSSEPPRSHISISISISTRAPRHSPWLSVEHVTRVMWSVSFICYRKAPPSSALFDGAIDRRFGIGRIDNFVNLVFNDGSLRDVLIRCVESDL